MTDALKIKFQRASQLLNQGQVQEAEREYLEIKRQDPRHFLATYNLAIVALHQGRLADAEKFVAEAMKLQPQFVQGLLLHAKVLSDLGRLDESLKTYDRFLKAQPGNADAWNDRAAVLLKISRFQEALSDVTKALALNADHVIALYNRATALEGLRDTKEALASLERALTLNPKFVEGMFFRGNLLRRIGQDEAAIENFRAALALTPNRTDISNNLGSVLFDLKRWVEALEILDKAIAISPKNHEAHINRGRTLGKLGRQAEELESYNIALTLRPNLAEGYVSRGVYMIGQRRFPEAIQDLSHALSLAPNHEKAAHAYGNALMSLGRREEAIAAYDQALGIKSDYPEVLSNRGLALRQLHRYEESAQTYTRLRELHPDTPYIQGDIFSVRLQYCDWSDYNETSAEIINDVKKGKRSENPFLYLAHSYSAAEQLACAEIWIKDKYPAALTSKWTAPPYANAKIKIAYASADFHNHATAHLMAELFEMHDRERFEFHAVSFGPDDGSDVRKRLRAAFDSFTDASTMIDDAVASLIRQKQIDIVVDLKGFTNDARPALFTKRAAPIQINYLGYPCTWGAACMDYIVADHHIIPPEDDIHYAEKVVRLPDSYQPNDRKRVIAADCPTRAESGLPETGFVFCSFNGSYKITPDVFDIWMRLLRAVDGSVLWLFENNPTVSGNLRKEAQARGVAAERLVFASLQPSARHLARHRLADLFLDTAPINAHTTASDALWAGLPLITHVGSTFAGRVAGSLLRAIGLSELIAPTWEDYEALALKLAKDPAALAEIKAKLHRNRDTHPLFDTPRYCRHLESAFTTIYERTRQGLPPESFDVTPIA